VKKAAVKKETQSDLHKKRVLQFEQTVAQWGPEAHGYSLCICPLNLGEHIRSSLYVVDVETDEREPAGFVGCALIDVRAGSRRIHYVRNFSEDLRNLLNKNSFIGHNVKADLHWFNQWGCKIQGSQIYGDTMIMAYCHDTTEESYGLKIQAKKQLGWEYPAYRDLVGKGAKKITLNNQSTDLVANYCGMDAAATFELFKSFKPDAYYHNIELPLYRLLFDIESKGAHLDVGYIESLNTELLNAKSQHLAELARSFGADFNPGSPKQVKEILFEKLGIQEEKTDVKVLRAYAHIPEIQTLLKFREVSKLASTYTTAFLALPYLPRVHCRFNQVAVSGGATEETTGIRTGRLSSSEPNLQNIPSRTELGAKLRGAFSAPFRHVLLGADYSQVEYRLLAHFSGEPKLIEAFKRGADVHEETGKALGVGRKLGKTLNFAAIYGAGSKKIAFTAGISKEEAEGFLEKYWRNLPGVKNWIQKVKALAYAKGGVTTMFGRFIPLKGLKSSDQYERWHSERAAVNYVIQGSAAEVIKLAMLRLQKIGLVPVLTVHDELIFEIKNDPAVIASVKERVEKTMANVVTLKVPLLVEAGVGFNWKEVKGK
jgi:DNA polymerase-1